MAKSRKKTLSQNVVHVATTGMPSPVRKILTGRLIALLIVLIVPVLFATGVVSVTWEDGRPRLNINKQRAAEVKSRSAERIEQFRDQHDDDQHGLPDFVRNLDHQDHGPIWEHAQAVDDQLDRATKKATGPLSRLKERFDNRR